MLADDHSMVLEALCKVLEPQCEIVGLVADGRALLKAAAELQPDVVVVDISMPLLSGLEAGRQLKEKMPAVKLIFLTMNEDYDLAVEAMRSGASAYLLKKSAASELFQAIQDTLEGKSYITPQIGRGIANCVIHNPRLREQARSLSSRQREVVHLIAEGKSVYETADILKISARTVNFHKYDVMRRLGLKASADLIRFAIDTRIFVA